jgi:hypothetical protein
LGLKEVRRLKKNAFRDGRNSQPAFKFNATLQLGNFIFLQINLTLQILNLPSKYNQKHWLAWWNMFQRIMGSNVFVQMIRSKQFSMQTFQSIIGRDNTLSF